MASGIQVALITTATGLCIGIPALVAFNYFTNKVDGLVMDLEYWATYLLNKLEQFQPWVTPPPGKRGADAVFTASHKRKAAINIISLVDVVFLLLIFFTVSATFMDQPALKIDLPESGAEPPDADAPEPMTVYITSQGDVYFGDQMVRPDELPEKFKQSLAEGKPPVLSVKADKEVIHGKVIEVMDWARQSGVEMVTVVTEKKSKQ